MTRPRLPPWSGRALQVALGLGLGLLFLWFAVRETEVDSVLRTLAAASPAWLGAAMALYAADLALRVARWRALLGPRAELSYASVARVLVVGYGVNTLLPARLGELFRVEYLKRLHGVARGLGLGSVALERLLDGVAVVACLALGLAVVGHADGALGALALSAAGLMLALAAALAAAEWLARRDWARLWRPLAARAADLRAALAVTRTPAFAGAALLTVAIYALEAAALACIVMAAGAPPSVALALVVVGAASLSTLLPSAPAFIGTYQFAFALSLTQFGHDAATGVAAATLAQGALFAPVAAAALLLIMAPRKKALHVVR